MQIGARGFPWWIAGPRMLVVYAVLVVPYLITYCSPMRPWVARTVAASLPIAVLTVGSFWWSLDPRTDVIAEGAKLRRPGYERSRSITEIVVRGLGVAFGVFFTAVITVPYVRDVMQVRERGPAMITGTVRSVQGLIIGLPLMKQSVYLRGDRRGKSLTLLYSIRSLRVGETYNFDVLPLSRIIVDAQQSAAE